MNKMNEWIMKWVNCRIRNTDENITRETKILPEY